VEPILVQKERVMPSHRSPAQRRSPKHKLTDKRAVTLEKIVLSDRAVPLFSEDPADVTSIWRELSLRLTGLRMCWLGVGTGVARLSHRHTRNVQSRPANVGRAALYVA